MGLIIVIGYSFKYYLFTFLSMNQGPIRPTWILVHGIYSDNLAETSEVLLLYRFVC